MSFCAIYTQIRPATFQNVQNENLYRILFCCCCSIAQTKFQPRRSEPHLRMRITIFYFSQGRSVNTRPSGIGIKGRINGYARAVIQSVTFFGRSIILRSSSINFTSDHKFGNIILCEF